MAKRRLDSLLADRGLFSSRTRAAASILAGDVLLGEGERRATKPGELVDPGERLRVRAQAEFVSRGGTKLANALDSSGVPVRGRRALDVGASTGGFSDCLLKRGAHAVVAVDVGYGVLAWSLREDPRVHVMERTNARSLTAAALPFAPDLAVIDVAFISLRKVLGAVLACMAPSYDVLALVKPQFELGRGRVGKGGVVWDASDRREALVDVGACALGLGSAVLGFHPSGLPGPKGNRETFVWLADPTSGAHRGGESALLPSHPRDSAAQELARLAREVEP
jgi:23S rRNA (cytidine1920-2'-O)/16S rRNA (cytidine1409-2'-O)-methyltransferase